MAVRWVLPSALLLLAALLLPTPSTRAAVVPVLTELHVVLDSPLAGRADPLLRPAVAANLSRDLPPSQTLLGAPLARLTDGAGSATPALPICTDDAGGAAADDAALAAVAALVCPSLNALYTHLVDFRRDALQPAPALAWRLSCPASATSLAACSTTASPTCTHRLVLACHQPNAIGRSRQLIDAAIGAGESRAVASADFDGDGVPEVVAGSTTGEVRVYQNLDGRGTFSRPRVVARVQLAARMFLAADLDGNGVPDLLAGFNGALLVFPYNRQSGDFAAPTATPKTFVDDPTRFSNNLSPTVIACVDLNNDTRMDLVVATSSGLYWVPVLGTAVAAATGDVTFLFGAVQLVAPAYRSEYMAMAVADMNMDGQLDIVAIRRFNFPDKIEIHRGLRNASLPYGLAFAPPDAVAGTFGTTSVLVLADINGDARPDVVVSGNDSLSTEAYVYFNRFTTASGVAALDAASTQLTIGAGKIDALLPLPASHQPPSTFAFYVINTTQHLFRFSHSRASGAALPVHPSLDAFSGYSLSDKQLMLASVDLAASTPALLTSVRSTSFLELAWYPLPPADPLPLLSSSKLEGTSSQAGFSVCDVNGDGRSDIVAIRRFLSSRESGVYVVLRQADGGLAPPQRISADHARATDLVCGDIDGAHGPDIALVDGSNAVYFALGQPGGTFAAFRTLVTTGAGFDQIALTDINADGHNDLVLSSTDNGGVFWNLNLDGFFGLQFGTGSSPIAPSLSKPTAVLGGLDLRGDGMRRDLLAASASERRIVWLRLTDTSPATWNTVQVAVGDLRDARAVAVGDWNGDGALDVAALGSSQLAMALLDPATRLFAPAVTLDASLPCSASVGSLAAHDFDRDGRPDLLVVCTNLVVWFHNRGHGLFSPAKTIDALQSSAVAGTVISDLEHPASTTAVLVWSMSGLSLLPVTSSNLTALAVSSSPSDRDLAALPWCAALDQSKPLFLSCLSCMTERNADGTCASVPLFTGSPRNIGAAGGDIIVAMATGDFNEDSIPDFVTISRSTTTSPSVVRLYAGDNSTSGTFHPPVEVAVAPNLDASGKAVVAADFNGDNHTDIAFSFNDDYRVVLGHGDGTFGALRRFGFDFQAGVEGLVAVDVDSSGTIDLLAGTYFSSNIFWFSNVDGTGSFPSPAVLIDPRHVTVLTLAVASTPTGLDLVLSDSDVVFATSRLLYYRGFRNGTFAPAVQISSTKAYALALEDFDGDGVTDLLHGGLHEVRLYRGLGARGAFATTGVLVGKVDTITSLAVTDVDGDGRPDIAVVSQDGVRVFVNELGEDGSPVFVLVLHDSSESATALLFLDVDGDGDEDLLAPGKTTQVVRLYINNLIDGTAPVVACSDGAAAYELPSSASTVVVGLDFDVDEESVLARQLLTVTAEGGGSTASFVQSAAEPLRLPYGRFRVQLSAVDSSNNTGRCVFAETIVVSDPHPPVITQCATNVLWLVEGGAAAPSAIPASAFASLVAEDNSDVVSRPVFAAAAAGPPFDPTVEAPPAADVYAVNAVVTDAANNNASCGFELVVVQQMAFSLSLAQGSFLDVRLLEMPPSGAGRLDVAVVEGGTQLPLGVVLERAAGRLTGTPLAAVPAPVSVAFRVCDTAVVPNAALPPTSGSPACAVFSVQVVVAAFRISWLGRRTERRRSTVPGSATSLLLPPATLGEQYRFVPSNVSAVGGSGCTTYNVVGELPAGLAMDESGVISGRPLAAGLSAPFQIAARDASGVSAVVGGENFTLQVEVGDCSAETCLNGGVCEDLVPFDGNFTCRCEGTAYFGSRCQQPRICSAGQEIVDGVCQQCRIGSTDDDFDGNTPCVACGAGTFVPAGSVGACEGLKCAAGTVDDDRDPTTPCVDCPGGAFVPAGSVGACVAFECAKGSVDHDSSAATPCVPCGPGGWVPAGRTGSCREFQCAAGWVDDDSDSANVCVNCGLGTYILPGSIGPCSDFVCHSGTIDHDSDPSTVCRALCGVGHYVPPAAFGSCTPLVCAAGTTDDDFDPSTPCAPCGPGSYAAPGSSGTCASLACVAGTVDDDSDASTECLPCLGTGLYVPPGQAGQACEAFVCETGTVDDDDDAGTPCVEVVAAAATSSSSDQGLMLIVAGACAGLVLLLLVVLLVKRRRRRRERDLQRRELDELKARVVRITEGLVPGGADTLRAMMKQLEMPRNWLAVQQKLGEGEFGEVVLAQTNSGQAVAVKQVKAGTGAEDQEKFLIEAWLTACLKHPHIVKVFAVVTDDMPFMVGLEYMVGGNLRDFLRSRRGEENGIEVGHLVDAAARLAGAMAHLERMAVIHRDLAARNVLVGKSLEEVKLADFGMSRAMEEKDYYRKTSDDKVPVKWMAPESIQKKVYSHKSDVWSFGVLLWEMFSFGAPPFEDLTAVETALAVGTGKRLERPSACPMRVFKLLQAMWALQPDKRPTFAVVENCTVEFVKEGVGAGVGGWVGKRGGSEKTVHAFGSWAATSNDYDFASTGDVVLEGGGEDGGADGRKGSRRNSSSKHWDMDHWDGDNHPGYVEEYELNPLGRSRKMTATSRNMSVTSSSRSMPGRTMTMTSSDGRRSTMFSQQSGMAENAGLGAGAGAGPLEPPPPSEVESELDATHGINSGRDIFANQYATEAQAGTILRCTPPGTFVLRRDLGSASAPWRISVRGAGENIIHHHALVETAGAGAGTSFRVALESGDMAPGGDFASIGALVQHYSAKSEAQVMQLVERDPRALGARLLLLRPAAKVERPSEDAAASEAYVDLENGAAGLNFEAGPLVRLALCSDDEEA